MEFNENSKRKCYNVDFDGILNTTKGFNLNPEPNYEAIEKVRELYRAGNIIIIWTARAYCYAQDTVAWLMKNGVIFHGIKMDKGGSDFYVDDRMLSIEDFKNMP